MISRESAERFFGEIVCVLPGPDTVSLSDYVWVHRLVKKDVGMHIRRIEEKLGSADFVVHPYSFGFDNIQLQMEGTYKEYISNLESEILKDIEKEKTIVFLIERDKIRRTFERFPNIRDYKKTIIVPTNPDSILLENGGDILRGLAVYTSLVPLVGEESHMMGEEKSEGKCLSFAFGKPKLYGCFDGLMKFLQSDIPIMENVVYRQ